MSKVIVPLYVYPSPTAWTPLEDVISVHPNVKFTVIINPSNGPGPDSLPDANYIRAIPRLSSHANVQLLGYVHTSYARRSIASICRDIETYAAWPINSSSPDLAVRGIFFDETPQQYDVDSAAYLQQLTQFVKGLNFSPNPYVIHNPGCVPDHRYLASADSTIIFEHAYSTFQERHQAKLLADIPRRWTGTAALIHSVPDSVKGPALRDLVRTVRKVADEVFITHLADGYYASFGAMWAEFVDLVAAESGSR